MQHTEPDISLDNLKILFLTRALTREHGRIVYLMNTNQICVISAPALPVIPVQLAPCVHTCCAALGAPGGSVFTSPASPTPPQPHAVGGCTPGLWLWMPPVPFLLGLPAVRVAAGLSRHCKEHTGGASTAAVGRGSLSSHAGDREQRCCQGWYCQAASALATVLGLTLQPTRKSLRQRIR